MPKKMNYIIKKLEKGPLQRFKNQNLLLKKFGEVGLKIYRAITGRRTVEELKKDLALDDAMFDPVIDYMTEAGMVELTPEGKKEAKKPEAPEAPPEEIEEEEIEEEEAEEEVPEEEAPEAPEIEIEKEEPKKPPKKEEEEGFFEEIEPIKPEGMEIEPEEEEAEEEPEEEVEPVEAEEEEPEPEEEPEEPEEEPEKEKEEIEAEEEPGMGIEIGGEEEEAEEELSSVEKIIKDKYGDTGVQVYNLIDGEKTAEEIMREVGVSESKLIEILDFMDKQGIIKLEYPGEKKAGKPAAAPPVAEEPSTGFVPILETERMGESKEVTIPNPVEVPAVVSGDIIKSVQMKAKVMLKYKDDGKKIFDSIDGKKDVIDIALKAGTSLPMVYDVLNFLMDNNMVMLKPMLREYVKKKYGEDGYNIYKRYGREGLMLYELIGRDMTFKQMADMVTKDKQRAVDMFLFIHEVLGIELPIDRDVLARQLGT